jgi:hypothetical protein
MLPNLPQHDHANQSLVDTILVCQDVPEAGTILRSDLPYDTFCEFGQVVFLTQQGALSRDHVGQIFGLRSFDQMARVDTKPNVAGMAGAWHWPVPIRYKKRQSMGSFLLAFEECDPVSLTVYREWPQETFVGVMGFNCGDQPIRAAWPITIFTHRCSSKASVSGAGTPSLASCPFRF